MSCTMTEKAVQSDKSLGLPLIEMSKIYADPIFNCRGVIAPMDVIELARDIAERGLQQPIILRPANKDTPPGYDWVVIAGHRRHMCYRVNQAPLIPAILRPELKDDEFGARTVNAIENLKRTDLNPLQEAKTVEHYKLAGWSRDQVATELGKSPGWVQVRFMILDLDPEIQEAIAAGLINSTQIRDLYSIKDRKDRLEAAKKIKEAKVRGDNKPVQVVDKSGKQILSKRKRLGPEIQNMMDIIVESLGGNCFATRAMAWCNGAISTLEFHTDIKKEAAKIGRVHIIPQVGLEEMEKQCV